MGHGHHHHHHDAADMSVTRLFITMALNFTITIVEVIGGILSGSLSLLSDALHNFSDGIAIIISYVAIRLSKLPSTSKYTFGLKRAEILAAVINSVTLIVISFYLFKESYHRFITPHEISGGLMIAVAGVGLIANVIGTLLLKKDSKDNMNIRAAYLHLLGDAISSVAVILGGIAIHFFNIHWIDPLLTIVISLYILIKSLEIMKEAMDVLMMGTPQHISLEKIKEDIEKIPEVKNLHHVHVWRLTDKHIHFEGHVDVVADIKVSETTPLLEAIEEILRHDHKISHITIQFESGKNDSKRLV